MVNSLYPPPLLSLPPLPRPSPPYTPLLCVTHTHAVNTIFRLLREPTQELKDAGMTDEDIYTELKALNNAISTPTSDATVASEDAKITAATPAGAAGATVAAADTPAERPGAAGADASEAADAPAEGGGEAAVPPAAVE